MPPLLLLALLLLALLLPACAPRVAWEDRFTPTAAACDFGVTGDAAGWLDLDAAFYPSEACVDAVLADFDVDTDSFLVADGLTTPYGAARGEGLDGARLSLVLGSARALLALDFGDVSEVEAGPLISAEYVEILDQVSTRTGASAVNAALYNFAASAITRTTALTESGGRASMGEGGHVVVRAGLSGGYTPGVVLVHEARHRWGGHGSCPWNRDAHCDPDPSLAHGFGLSSMALLLRQTEDPDFREYLGDRLRTQLRHIESTTDDEGALTEEAEAALAEALAGEG